MNLFNPNETTGTIRIIEQNGKKIVEIDSILFSGKRKIDWESVEKYFKKYIGKYYIMDELDEIVHIGKDFPDEYGNSNDSVSALGTIGKTKANISQAIPQLIKTATNILFQENKDPKHNQNAKYGWYRCTVRFTLPVYDTDGNIIRRNTFQGRMLIRHDKDGKKYLYDIINIKKET